MVGRSGGRGTRLARQRCLFECRAVVRAALRDVTQRVPSRLDEVAGSSSDELTGYRRSRTSALEAQEGGTSRGPLCDRFGWKEIPGVRPQPGWTVALRGAVRHALVAGVLAAT